MMTKNQKIIVSYIVFPLIILSVLWYGYAIVDAILISYTKGSMVLEGSQKQTVSLTKCRLIKDSGNNPALIITDGKTSGLEIYAEGQPSVTFTPFLNNKKLPSSYINCKVLNSNLRLADIKFGRIGRSGAIQSWKGSIAISCVNGDEKMHITASVHGCQ